MVWFGGTTVEIEDVLTGQWGVQIRSWKDIIQFDYEDMKILTDKTKEGLR
jgi:hypothetical protein